MNFIGLRVSEETELLLEIRKNINSPVSSNGDYWCYVDITIRNHNFEIRDAGELITYYELTDVNNSLKDIINNKVVETTEVEIIEPDLDFIVNKSSLDLRLNINDLEFYNVRIQGDNLAKLSKFIDELK